MQARLITPKMGEALARTPVVDNRPSANGLVATEICARAEPDGATTCVGNSGTHAVNATLYRTLSCDPIRDFAPISQLSTTGMVLAANPALPGRTVLDLAQHAKENRGKTNIAIAGATGPLAGDALWARLGIKMNNVPYKGSSPSEVDAEVHAALSRWEAINHGRNLLTLAAWLSALNALSLSRV